MEHHAEKFHLAVDAPPSLVKRPKLWRLIIGLACIPLAFSLFWLEPINAYWTAKHLGDPHTIGIMILFVGSYAAVSAFANDFLQVHEALCDKDGMHLFWTSVPSLLSCRLVGEKYFKWHDFASLHWDESDSDHDLQQYIQIEFKEFFGAHRSFLKLRISDDRNFEQCEKLISLLPNDFAVPEWVRVARKNNYK